MASTWGTRSRQLQCKRMTWTLTLTRWSTVPPCHALTVRRRHALLTACRCHALSMPCTDCVASVHGVSAWRCMHPIAMHPCADCVSMPCTHHALTVWRCHALTVRRRHDGQHPGDGIMLTPCPHDPVAGSALATWGDTGCVLAPCVTMPWFGTVLLVVRLLQSLTKKSKRKRITRRAATGSKCTASSRAGKRARLFDLNHLQI